MSYSETPIVFDCEGESLLGILATPVCSNSDLGVVVVVGGPQYRAGSHRQFVLLSRELAAAGIHCFRFDYRGMGDSEGEARNFDNVENDIREAVNTLLEYSPGIKRIALWGLCDGATAAAFYATVDKRISGLVMLNPWVHTEKIKAQVILKRYYFRRFFSASFWQKIRNGEFDFAQGLAGLKQTLGKMIQPPNGSKNDISSSRTPLPERLHKSLTDSPAKTLIILSGNDFVANEFEDLTRNDPKWQQLLRTVELVNLPKADHTLTDPAYLAQVNRKTVDWLSSL